MANIFDQIKSFVPGVQQLFQNVGYNRQQGGQSSGYVPRALGGSGMVAPSFPTAYASDGGGQVLGTSTAPSGFNSDGRFYTPSANPGGVGTGGSGGGGGGGAGSGFIPPSGQPTQPPSNNGMLDAIRARLDEARNQARQQISRAGEERDYLLGFAKDQFGQLRQRAGDRLGTSLETLDQEGNKLINIYERSRGDTRRRSANEELQNRNRARALNRLDSSFYDDIQAENTADLTRGLGVLDVEEADKSAALGTRRTETNQYFNEILQDIDTQQSQAERQAQQEYQNAVAQGEALERAGVLDYGEGVQQAEAAYQSRLDQIKQAADNLALQKLSLAAQISTGGQSVNSFNAINDSLSGTLADNAGMESVANADPNLLSMVSAQTPAQQFFGRQNKKLLDQRAFV